MSMNVAAIKRSTRYNGSLMLNQCRYISAISNKHRVVGDTVNPSTHRRHFFFGLFGGSSSNSDIAVTSTSTDIANMKKDTDVLHDTDEPILKEMPPPIVCGPLRRLPGTETATYVKLTTYLMPVVDGNLEDSQKVFIPSEKLSLTLFGVDAMSPREGLAVKRATVALQPHAIFLGQPNWPIFMPHLDVDEFRNDVSKTYHEYYMGKYTAIMEEALEKELSKEEHDVPVTDEGETSKKDIANQEEGKTEEQAVDPAVFVDEGTKAPRASDSLDKDHFCISMWAAVDALRELNIESAVFLGDMPKYILYHHYFNKLSEMSYGRLEKASFHHWDAFYAKISKHVRDTLPLGAVDAEIENETNRVMNIAIKTLMNEIETKGSSIVEPPDVQDRHQGVYDNMNNETIPEEEKIYLPGTDVVLPIPSTVLGHVVYQRDTEYSIFVDGRAEFLASYMYAILQEYGEAGGNMVAIVDNSVVTSVLRHWNRINEEGVHHGDVLSLCKNKDVTPNQVKFIQKSFPEVWKTYLEETPETRQMKPGLVQSLIRKVMQQQ